jgi:hypothetical protein
MTVAKDDRVPVRVDFIRKVGRLEKAAEGLIKERRERDKARASVGRVVREPLIDELEKAWKDLAIS